MKLFLVIFTIALVAQVTFGASIQRSKREADEKKDVFEIWKDIFAELRSKFEVVYKEIPNTDAYAKYRKSFEELFTLYDEKDDNEQCIDKTLKLLDKFGDMIESGEKDESEEATKIKEIFAKYKDEEFEQKYESAFKNAKELEFFELFENCKTN